MLNLTYAFYSRKQEQCASHNRPKRQNSHAIYCKKGEDEEYKVTEINTTGLSNWPDAVCHGLAEWEFLRVE